MNDEEKLVGPVSEDPEGEEHNEAHCYSGLQDDQHDFPRHGRIEAHRSTEVPPRLLPLYEV